MLLKYLIVISGIFGKSEDLEILPPPPPFPDIRPDKKLKEAAKAAGKPEKQRKTKPKNGKVPRLISSIKKEEIELPEPKQKKPFFGKLLGKGDEELERELEEIEEIKPRQGAKLIAKKLPELEFGEKVKPEDIKVAQEEIRKSIEGIQGNGKTSFTGRLFKKKEKEDVIGKIELPEVMPRTFDKIDNVQEIEEKIHRARMFLMDFKFEGAKTAYIQIMQMYNALGTKDRAKVYEDIRDLYYERKSAEKFAGR